MPDDFTTCKNKDEAQYGYFACQFFESLTRYQTTDPKGYWLGRVLAYGFTFDNLALDNVSVAEESLREDLENGDIIFHGYTLVSVSYTPEPNNPSNVSVSGKVELDLTINGQRQTITPSFTQSIKQFWHSTNSRFS